MGFIEKLLPDTIPLTEEQFKTFVEQTIATEHSCRVLDGLTAQNAATAPAQGAGTAGRGNTQPAAKTAQTAQEGGADGSRNGAGRKGNGLAERGRGSTTLPLASLGVTAPLFCQWTRGYVRAVLKRA